MQMSMRIPVVTLFRVIAGWNWFRLRVAFFIGGISPLSIFVNKTIRALRSESNILSLRRFGIFANLEFVVIKRY